MNHRLILLFLVMFCVACTHTATQADQGGARFFISAQTPEGEPAVYTALFDASTGTIRQLRVAAQTEAAGCLAIRSDGKYLFTAGASTKPGVQGSLLSYRIRPGGDLVFVSRQPSGGENPCYLDLNEKGTNALVANYRTGSVASFSLDADARISPAATVVQQEIDGDAGRAHAIRWSPDERFAVATDIRLGRLYLYRFNPESGGLSAHGSPVVYDETANPRHLVFHPNRRFAYVLHQRKGVIDVFSYDAEGGELEFQESVSVLPLDALEGNHCAEIRVHPSGRFIYCSNRGHDSISSFRIDPETGKLSNRSWTASGGNAPWWFEFDPTGNFLLVTNDKSNNLVVLRIDPKSGETRPTGQTVTIPSPRCVRFIP
jgi:6-phosphogluconolactonase